MILIFTKEREPTTDDVIDWIFKDEKDIVRIDNTSKLTDLVIPDISNENEVQLELGSIKIDLKDVNSVWFRKGKGFNFDKFSKNILNNHEEKNGIFNEINDSIYAECQTLKEYINHILISKNTLGNVNSHFLNKSIMLLNAKECGFKIPKSSIITKKRDLKSIKYELITKALHESVVIRLKEGTFGTYTSLLDQNIIESLEESNFPLFVQEAISKEFEIRSFYINSDIYSMAIFSQNDKQTSTDYRIYNSDKPSRYVPFKLPLSLEKKIDKFMKLINLNSGSIDFIYSKEKEYVFLEVNPTGQFGMVSDPCNYYLEKKVAEYLVK